LVPIPDTLDSWIAPAVAATRSISISGLSHAGNPYADAVFLLRGENSMHQDPYESFAGSYHRFYPEFDTFKSDYIRFFRKSFTTHRVNTLLDCACGIGRDLVLFHRLGLRVWGSDVSAAMLKQARRNLARRGLNIPLKKADFRTLPSHFSRKFDGIVCMSTSLPHLPNRREVVKALKSMRSVLRPGGILILTQGLSDRLQREKIRFVPEKVTPEFSRIMVVDYLKSRVTIHVLDITPSHPKQPFRIFSFPYLALGRADYVHLLKQSGFTRVFCYGDFHFTPYDEATSGRIVIVARNNV
jgi:ubiquinone/menaquinone biosynthesis C-methylase UbiE